MIESVPSFPGLGVKVTVHPPEFKVHEMELKAPAVVPRKTTVPDGLIELPLPALETFTAQVV